MAVTTMPTAHRATEKELVSDFAETADLHGFKVRAHTVKEDHEREETTLTVTFIKANPNQQTLPLKGKKSELNGEAGDGDD